MHLAVTVGWDADLVIRGLTEVGLHNVEELTFLVARTGTDGDRRSREAVGRLVNVMRRGTPVEVDVVDVARGILDVANVGMDTVMLAGGPRILNIIAFVVAVMEKRRIIVVPEYEAGPIDVSALSALRLLCCLTEPQLRTLTNIDDGITAVSLAEKMGVDTSTANRHVTRLEETGVVSSSGSRPRRYFADPLTKRLAELCLKGTVHGHTSRTK